jgi:hypothetical protein
MNQLAKNAIGNHSFSKQQPTHKDSPTEDESTYFWTNTKEFCQSKQIEEYKSWSIPTVEGPFSKPKNLTKQFNYLTNGLLQNKIETGKPQL